MEPDPSSHRKFLFAAGTELLIGFFAVVLSWLGGVQPHETMPKLGETMRLAEGVGYGLILGGAMASVLMFLERFPIVWLHEASSMAEEHLATLIRGCNVWHLLVLSLTAGVGEELLFRGWLQGTLVRELQVLGPMGIAMGILLASLGFGIAHPLSRGYVFVATCLGVVLGLAAFFSENLFVAIVGHAVYDAILLVLFARKLKSESSSS